MAAHHATEAVVVGAVDLGEADRVIRLLTPDEGRISALARGARASRRRWAGLLETGTRLQVELAKGRGDLPSIAGGERLAGPTRAREDVGRVALLAWGCELCAALAPEHHPAPKLFQLLVTWLEVLEGEARPGRSARLALEAKALTFAGLAPALVRCARCGMDLGDPAVFDAEEGGGMHACCGPGTPVSARALAALEGLRWTPLARAVSEADPPGEATWILADFAAHQLGRPLRSRAFLEELDRAG